MNIRETLERYLIETHQVTQTRRYKCLSTIALVLSLLPAFHVIEPEFWQMRRVRRHDDIAIEPRAGESAAVPQLRASLLGTLGLIAADPEIVAHWRKIASELISTTNLTWRPEMYGPLRITTVHGDAAWVKKVQKAFENSTSPEMHARLLHALIGFRDPALVRDGLDSPFTSPFNNSEV